MLRTKHAPAPASSKILDKRWKEHNYQLHQYRLLAMYGEAPQRPSYSNPYKQQNTASSGANPPLPSSKRREVKSAKGRSQKSTVEIPRADENTPRRPFTSKPGLRTRPSTTKHKAQDSQRGSGPTTPRDKRVGTARKGTAKEKKDYSRDEPPPPSGRKENVPPKRPMMQQWIKPRARGYQTLPKRYRSEYSRDKMDKHYKKHQYIKHNILHRPGAYRSLDTNKSGSDSNESYSDDFNSDSTEILSPEEDGEESDEENEGRGYIPSATPTPEPVKEVDKLDFDANLDKPDTPPPMPIVEYPKVEINFTPPSHVLKIVADAKEEEGSDWSEDEPVYVLKDGKKGTYIMRDQKYYLKDTVKENKRSRLKKTLKDKRKAIEQGDIKEIQYINYKSESDEEADDEQEEENEQTFDGMDQEGEGVKEEKKEQVKDDEEEEKKKVVLQESESESESETDTDVTEEEKQDEKNKEQIDNKIDEDVDDELANLLSADEKQPPHPPSESEYDSEGNKITKVKSPPKEEMVVEQPTKRRKKRRKKKKTVYMHYKTSDDETEERKRRKVEKEEEERKIREEKNTIKNKQLETGIVYNKEDDKLEDDDDMDFKEFSESSTDEEDRKKLIVIEEAIEAETFATLRPETIDEKFFDAKGDQDSDSDLDEFGRLKDRQRPSSTLFDFLPPLKPDERLDNGDITHCKNRLSRHVVIIREALARNGPGDLEVAVDVIISNNCDNRRWLRKIYRDSYLQSLLLDLRKTLPADVASVMSYMMIPVCEFDAMCLWDALKGLHKDANVLCEILCTRTNKELEEIRNAYSLRYGEELIDHVEDETISAFQRMMMRLASGQREEEANWTKDDAAREAKAISALLKLKGQHCTKKLIDVFCQHPIEMLQAIIKEYKKLTERELDSDLISILKGNFQMAIITIIHYIQNPPNFFVERLHATHYRGVDDDKSLCRLIISRSESDKLEMIKQLFVLRYHMTLYDYIDRVCSGPLKGMVLRIVAGQLTDDERDMFDFPPLWPGREDANKSERLTLPRAIITILRRAKVTTKFAKVLWAQREKQREEDESASDYDDPDEVEEAPMDNNGTDPAVEEQKDVNSEEEEEAEERAAQRELKNGLKNISFADDVEINEFDDFHSIFKDISFANASRGILKNVNPEVPEEELDEDGVPIPNEEDALGNHQLTQLNGPVIDPTFSGRGPPSIAKVPFKGKKKPMVRCTVTGVSMEHFNALKDAQAIGKALLQKKRNVEGILQFLTTRNNAQRQLVIREFFRRYRRDLVDDLRKLGPYFENITLALLLANEIYDAVSLFAGINHMDQAKGVDIIISVLCSRQNDEVAIIRRAFQGIFGLNLIEELEKMTVGFCQDMLCLIAECQRDESQNIEQRKVTQDAQNLYESLLHRPPDCKAIANIFGTRNFIHINHVCDEFLRINKADILEAIETTLVGTFKEAVTAIICNTRDAPMYFCERIYKCMAYEPPDYSNLIRDVVSRSEVDLAIIKVLYRRTYGRTIYSMIEKDHDFREKKILLDVVKKFLWLTQGFYYGLALCIMK
eukprot:TCONS_00007569-protein